MEPTDQGYSYFPLKTGSWIIYDADSVLHSLDAAGNPKSDTVHFQLKYLMENSDTDNEGRTYERVLITQRRDTSDAWDFPKACTATLTQNTAEFMEDNVRRICLSFPVKERSVWNGNAYNTLPAQQYKYSAADIPLKINSMSFDSSLTVIRTDDGNQNLIQRQYEAEKYVRHIGLVYKESIFLEKDIVNRIIKGGYEYRLKIRSRN